MRLRTLIVAAVVGCGLIAATSAEAKTVAVKVTVKVNVSVELREGPGNSYRLVATAPRHAPLRVYHCATWCEVTYGNYRGYASAEFVAGGKHKIADRLLITPVKTSRGIGYAPIYVKPQEAYISTTFSRCHGNVARIWYYDGRWADRPDYFMIVER
jgi:uncharacterized protein YraI